MRILHTSDWHAGRLWKSQDRLSELQDVLEHLGDFIEHEHIDLVLMSGDVFESQMPAPEAERAVSRFFKRLGRADIPSVVVAGNHDHPMRIDTWGLLAEFVEHKRVACPVAGRRVAYRNTDSLRSHRLCCVPWASPGRIVEALRWLEIRPGWRKDADAMQRILAPSRRAFDTTL
jgi:exonuclease SbcD